MIVAPGYNFTSPLLLVAKQLSLCDALALSELHPLQTCNLVLKQLQFQARHHFTK
jgi:hypothetical protein